MGFGKPIKVMHINISYAKGGAGIAGANLYNALQDHFTVKPQKLDLQYLHIGGLEHFKRKGIINPLKNDAGFVNIVESQAQDPIVSPPTLIKRVYHTIKTNKLLMPFFESVIKSIRATIQYWLFRNFAVKEGMLFMRDGGHTNPKILDAILECKPDIIHLHWIISMVDIKTIREIAQKTQAKLVWTTHDMWPYTGGCNYNFKHAHSENKYHVCDKWKSGCKNCPSIYGNKTQDLSFELFNKKKEYLSDLDITFVSPAKWAENHIKESALFSTSRTYHIPNAYNTDVFKEHNREFARKQYALPLDKKIILFGNIYSRWKGGAVFSKALQHVTLDDVVLVSFGPSNHIDSDTYPIIHIGSVAEESQLALLYSAADIMAVPSIIDIGPSTAIEAMLCGTPVVAFNRYGPSEFIVHKKNGYLAQAYQAKDFAQGIQYILQADNYSDIRAQARADSYAIFDDKGIAEKYYQVYRDVTAL